MRESQLAQPKVTLDNIFSQMGDSAVKEILVVVKAAEPRIVELLVASGVRLVTWSLPDELNEPKVGRPIDHDDLLDFHTLLESDGWMEDLHRMTAR